ncbi:MAG: DNA mismatch repair endonuclease MutL [Desulfuromonas sp.]|nr:DNA mismatch repair endonuclease MutL [Desulfuromonas sp.]
MIQHIQILPEQLCNQIAAGEVVERPASVVKELVENSLDAGADKIVVEVERGGKKRIVVADNGFGMGNDDLFLCFERHATSKIRTEEDLFKLQYHGFRGEALPSIAAVSRLVVTSRSADDDIGSKLTLTGGKVRDVIPAGVAAGTTFEVKDLFFNLPARRKFLRRDETEFAHIAEVVTRIALAHPSVHFKLVHNGRTALELYKNKDGFDRVVAVLGRSVVPDLLEVSSGKDMHLGGYLLRPNATRGATTGIYCFVNGRFVKDRVFHHAIMEGYRHLIMKGRYPICVLFLTLDPAKVDVNVHPTKHEVRFHEQQQVHSFVTSSIREVLRQSECSTPVRNASDPSLMVQSELAVAEASFLPPSVKDSDHNIDADRTTSALTEDKGRFIQEPSIANVAEITPEYKNETQAPVPDDEHSEQQLLPETDAGYFSQLTILGQFHRSYVVCEDGDDLLLIDQHAAHERIGFERLKRQYSLGEVERQELLFPVVLELSVRQDTELRQYIEHVQRLGFDLQHFGGTSWSVSAMPTYLDGKDVKTIICDILTEIGTVGKSTSSQDAFDAVLITMACHGMIRANQKLDIVEMGALLQQLDEVDFNRQCPHGRPIVQNISLHTIEKMFRRVL